MKGHLHAISSQKRWPQKSGQVRHSCLPREGGLRNLIALSVQCFASADISSHCRSQVLHADHFSSHPCSELMDIKHTPSLDVIQGRSEKLITIVCIPIIHMLKFSPRLY